MHTTFRYTHPLSIIGQVRVKLPRIIFTGYALKYMYQWGMPGTYESDDFSAGCAARHP